MQPAVFDKFRCDERGKTDIKSLRVSELQEQLREQLRLQTKREFSSELFLSHHSAAGVDGGG